MLRLRFDRGTLRLDGDVATPYGKWDSRIGGYRAKAFNYADVLDYLKSSGVKYVDEVLAPPPLERLSDAVNLRGYQQEALNRWRSAGYRGILVLPTAAGKTFIALKAISLLNVQSLIVVPTLDLIDQWRKRVKSLLGVDAGAVGGGECDVRMVTVSTYDSAYTQAEQLGNRFLLVVFDEVHHLASPGYIQIAEMYVAPYRMGLTATLERGDQRHLLLPPLVGDVVYTARVDELAGKHLAPYVYERLTVELTPEEQRVYDAEMSVFKDYLREKKIVLKTAADFQKFIMATGRDPRAREALLARNRAFKVALNSEAKLSLLAQKLDAYRRERVLIFTLHNDLVYAISRRFLIPAVTYQTPREERREILHKFAAGEYRAIVTSQVLDEGVDVPEASVGLVLSGTGSTREYIQRLGRLLRKVEGKTARLVEIISKETVEVGISRRRRLKPREA
jgi:superfamily II DNA or RNA helicase